MAVVDHRTADHVVGDMRQRILEGIWRPEQMLPGRRALAAEYGVALATLERAVAVLMAEGMLRADNRRGTFVASTATELRKPAVPAASHPSRAPLVATVAVVASIAQEVSDNAAQWPLNILRACEDQLGTVPGITMRVVNAITRRRVLRSPTAVMEEIQQAAPDGIVLISNFAQFHPLLLLLKSI